tara:strand:+ start:328 stop:507 length:180 start_codon:yes stop_codon:yes gene_type:complete
MGIVGMKKKCSFTIDDQLIEWFKLYAKDESTTMSAVLNQYILSLKRGGSKPKNVLYTNR